MSTDISSQLRSLLLSLAAGIALGLLYDILRPPRRGMGGAAAVMLDGAFCCVAGGVLFCIAMADNNGRLGTWELASAAAGFLGYMHTLSNHFLRIFSNFYHTTEKGLGIMKKILRKSAKTAKFYFQNTIKCIMIKMKKPDADSAETE